MSETIAHPFAEVQNFLERISILDLKNSREIFDIVEYSRRTNSEGKTFTSITILRAGETKPTLTATQSDVVFQQLKNAIDSGSKLPFKNCIFETPEGKKYTRISPASKDSQIE